MCLPSQQTKWQQIGNPAPAKVVVQASTSNSVNVQCDERRGGLAGNGSGAAHS